MAFDPPATYVAGAGELRYQAPDMNLRNFELSDGRDDAETVGRVIDGRKPCAFVTPRSAEQARQWTMAALQAGCSAQATHSARGWWLVSVAAHGYVHERFDLDTLTADYRLLLAPAGGQIADAVARELDRIAHADLSLFCEFTHVEVSAAAHRRDGDGAAEYARCGLLLGYPHLTSAALILDRLGIPGFGVRPPVFSR